jgi:hypothetical protein
MRHHQAFGIMIEVQAMAEHLAHKRRRTSDDRAIFTHGPATRQ